MIGRHRGHRVRHDHGCVLVAGVEDLHKGFVYATIGLIVLHVAGVVFPAWSMART